MSYQKQWVERDDNVEGYVYLLEAEGFHGLYPGCILHRCKIGLTRNLQNRLNQLESGQTPCDYKIIRTVYVENMASVEADLHRQFKHCNVKLHRSREFFDFNSLEYWQVKIAFEKYGKARYNYIKLPSRLIVGSLIGLIGTALLLHSATPQPTPSKLVTTSHQLLHNKRISH